MKRLLALTAFATLASASLAGGPGWHTSYDKAIAESKKTGKPILADFTGSDWCYWCKVLDKEVFETSEFKTWAKKNVVLLYLDYPQAKKLSPELTKQNEKLAEKFKIRGYPTVLVINSKGAEIGKLGYMEGGPKKWIAEAEKSVKKAK